MAYYDRIARRWHALTGARGGALKEFVLNDALLDRMAGIDNRSILEIGAGNGYLLPLVRRRFSGQVPRRIVITDVSRSMLAIAQLAFPSPDAEYQILDVRGTFPFDEGAFDLVLAGMVFNELSDAALRRTIAECTRTLSLGGKLLATVVHPQFVDSLRRRGLLRRVGGVTTMPGTGGLRLPVVPRDRDCYQAHFVKGGWECTLDDIYPTLSVLRAKPGLREAGPVPLALLIECVRGRAT
jgi:SAM-dependent methyltransferase